MTTCHRDRTIRNPVDGRPDSVTRGNKVHPRQIGGLLVGVVVAGIATILLALAALRDFQGLPAGDLVPSTAMISTALSLAILLVVLLAILRMESTHLRHLWLTRMSLRRVLGRGPRVVMQTPADQALRPYHSVRDRPGRRPWRHGPA
jgi:hypothetical protein